MMLDRYGYKPQLTGRNSTSWLWHESKHLQLYDNNNNNNKRKKMIIITDLYSAFMSEDTEALDAAQED